MDLASFDGQNAVMIDQLLASAKDAILKRNPGLGAYLQPGLPAEVIRKGLKQAGIQGHVEEVVAVFSHFDGATFPKENEAWRLGFAPPVVKTMQLPAATVQMMEALGHKVDPTRTIYGSYFFARWEGVIYGMKHWRKFASNPRNGVLVGRVVPFFVYGETKQELAFDTDPSGGGRIISIQPQGMKDVPALTQAYASLEEFLRDLIEANERHRCLAWPGTLGTEIELPMPAPKVAAKGKKKMLPETEKVLVVRTCFSSDAKWESLRGELEKSNESGMNFQFVSDDALAGLSAAELTKRLPDGHAQPIAVIADEATLNADERTLLVVDLQDQPGQTFRVMPACLGEVYDNLLVANVEFAEFVEAAQGDGVYRGNDVH